VHHIARADGGLKSWVFWEPGTHGDVQADRGCMLLRTGDTWQVVDPTWTDAPLKLQIAGRPVSVNPPRGRSATVK